MVAEKICRLCLSPGKDLLPLFDDEKFIRKLMVCASIDVSTAEKLPATVCISCVVKLNEFYDFREIIRNSDLLLKSKSFISKKKHIKQYYSTGVLDSALIEHEKKKYLSRNVEKGPSKVVTSSKGKVPKERGDENKSECQQSSVRLKRSKFKKSKKTTEEKLINRKPKKISNERRCIRKIEKLQRKDNDVISQLSSLISFKNVDNKQILNYEASLLSLDSNNIKNKKTVLEKKFQSKKIIKRAQSSGKRSRSRTSDRFSREESNKECKPKPSLHAHSKRSHGTVRIFDCKICHESFAQSSELASHLRSHSGMKQHECGLCKRTFSKQEFLKKHMRVHAGQLPYACSFCSRSFKTRWNLKQHSQIHNSAKLYQCTQCDKTFKHNVILQHHINIVHKS